MLTSLRLSLLAVAFAISAASTLLPNNDFEPPPPDVCSPGATQGASSLELGTGDEISFDALAEDRVVDLVSGGQGTDMLPLRYRVRGTSDGCLAVSVRIYRCSPMGARCDDDSGEAPELVANRSQSLTAYADGDGRSTKADFVLFETFVRAGSRYLVEATVAGAQISMHVWATVELDAGVGAADADVLDAALDAAADGPPADAQ